MTDPSSPMAADLLSERFSRDSTAVWWPTPEPHAPAEVMTYLQQLSTDEEALDGTDPEHQA